MKRGRSLEVIGSASQQDESDPSLITQVRSRAMKARADRGDTQRGKNVSTVVGSVTRIDNQPLLNKDGVNNSVNSAGISTVGGDLKPLFEILQSQHDILNYLQQQVLALSQNVHVISSFLGVNSQLKYSSIPPSLPLVDTDGLDPRPNADHDTLSQAPSTASTASHVDTTGNANAGSSAIIAGKSGNEKCNTFSNLINDTLSKVHSDYENRARSVMISGMPEREDDDVPPVLDLFHHEFNFYPGRVYCRRVGPRCDGSRPRLLQVSFQSKEEAQWLLTRAPKLRTSRDRAIRSYIYISRNLTVHERTVAYKERQRKRMIRVQARSDGSTIYKSSFANGVETDCAQAVPDLNDLTAFPPLGSSVVDLDGPDVGSHQTISSGVHPITQLPITGDHPVDSCPPSTSSSLSATARPFVFVSSASGGRCSNGSGSDGRPVPRIKC
jgi:hypothetical protein